MSLTRVRVEEGCGGVSFEHHGLDFNLLHTAEPLASGGRAIANADR